MHHLRPSSPLVIAAILLIILGSIISTLPLANYYFGTYLHETYHDQFVNGSQFVYYGEYGTFFLPNGSDFTYGIVLSFRYLGSSNFSLNGSLYELTGNIIGLNLQLLPNNPFIAQKQVLIASSNYTLEYGKNNDLHLLFPANSRVDAGFASFPITNSTYFSATPLYLGFSKFYSARPGGFNISSDVLMGGHYVMFGYLTSSNMAELMQPLFPKVLFPNQSSYQFELYLGSGNSIPAQDWAEGFAYSFELFFPVNIIMYLIAAILIIIKVRRVR